jgi:HEAT repeat protein
LKTWVADPAPAVRAAVMRAMGTVGLDADSASAAVRALDDTDADVRAMAARALGRARWRDAAPALAHHLDDDWAVAANSADALRRIGRSGLDLLGLRVDDAGYAGDLARQMLWERRTAQPGS